MKKAIGLILIMFLTAAPIFTGAYSKLMAQDSENIEQNDSMNEKSTDGVKKFDEIGGISTFTKVFMGFIQLIISIGLGLFIVFITFKILIKLTRDLDEEEELKKNNIAEGVLLGSSLFGVTILVKRSLYPIFSVMQNLAISPEVTVGYTIKIFFYSIGYIMVSLIVAISILILATKAFDWFTGKLDEFEEIKNNNIAVAIFFAGVVLSLCFFIEEGLHSLLITLIPGPTVNIL